MKHVRPLDGAVRPASHPRQAEAQRVDHLGRLTGPGANPTIDESCAPSANGTLHPTDDSREPPSFEDASLVEFRELSIRDRTGAPAGRIGLRRSRPRQRTQPPLHLRLGAFGSTLLEMLLTDHPQIVAVGELAISATSWRSADLAGGTTTPAPLTISVTRTDNASKDTPYRMQACRVQNCRWTTVNNSHPTNTTQQPFPVRSGGTFRVRVRGVSRPLGPDSSARTHS